MKYHEAASAYTAIPPRCAERGGEKTMRRLTIFFVLLAIIASSCARAGTNLIDDASTTTVPSGTSALTSDNTLVSNPASCGPMVEEFDALQKQRAEIEGDTFGAQANWQALQDLATRSQDLGCQGDLAITPSSSNCNVRGVVRDTLLALGYNQDSWVWEEQINPALAEATRASDGAFSSTPAPTRDIFVPLVNGSTPGGVAIRDGYFANLSPESKALFSSGLGFVPVQMTIKTVQHGNTVLDQNGRAWSSPAITREIGDIVWFFVGASCTLEGTAIRGGCMNPQSVPPIPKSPPPTTTSTTTTVPTTTSTTTTVPHGKSAGEIPPIPSVPPTTSITKTVPPIVSTTTLAGQGDSGSGATNVVPPPPTVAPAYDAGGGVGNIGDPGGRP